MYNNIFKNKININTYEFIFPGQENIRLYFQETKMPALCFIMLS